LTVVKNLILTVVDHHI